MQSVIELSHVSFAYNSSQVLEDISMEAKERDFIAIIGPNGGGKTTILKLILGLLKPSEGKVSVFGDTPENARTRIGYMPQSASLDPMFPVSVLDVVLMGRLGTGVRFGRYRRSDRAAAEEALKRVELLNVKNRPFSALSGGQHQRVLIARALVSDPDLLLLDEPTANVDAAVETQLYDLLNQLNERLTIVLVTHDLGFVSKYVKTVVCVNRRLLCHPTCGVTSEIMREIYGHDIRMVNHGSHEKEDAHE